MLTVVWQDGVRPGQGSPDRSSLNNSRVPSPVPPIKIPGRAHLCQHRNVGTGAVPGILGTGENYTFFLNSGSDTDPYCACLVDLIRIWFLYTDPDLSLVCESESAFWYADPNLPLVCGSEFAYGMRIWICLWYADLDLPLVCGSGSAVGMRIRICLWYADPQPTG